MVNVAPAGTAVVESKTKTMSNTALVSLNDCLRRFRRNRAVAGFRLLRRTLRGLSGTNKATPLERLSSTEWL